MARNKVINILKCLSQVEHAEFLEFLNCTMFNKSERLIEFYNSIRSIKLDQHSWNRLDTSIVAQQMNLDESKINRILNQLKTKIEEYVAHKQIQQYPLFKKHLYLDWLIERGDKHLFF